MDNKEIQDQRPVIIKEGGGNGIAVILAAVILGGSAIIVANIWSNTQQKMIDAPSKAIQGVIEGGKGIVKEAQKAIQGTP